MNTVFVSTEDAERHVSGCTLAVAKNVKKETAYQAAKLLLQRARDEAHKRGLDYRKVGLRDVEVSKEGMTAHWVVE